MKTNGPWKIRNSEIKYENPWIKIREDKVTRSDGREGIFGVVEMVAGISVLPMDDDGFVYLGEKFHYAIKKRNIAASSGAIEPGEKPLDAAKRELKEELGITAKNWVDLGTVNPFTVVVRSPAQLFLARKLKLGKPKEAEIDKIVKMKFEKAVQMVMNSEITHGPSCVLILKAARYLKI